MLHFTHNVSSRDGHVGMIIHKKIGRNSAICEGIL